MAFSVISTCVQFTCVLPVSCCIYVYDCSQMASIPDSLKYCNSTLPSLIILLIFMEQN